MPISSGAFFRVCYFVEAQAQSPQIQAPNPPISIEKTQYFIFWLVTGQSQHSECTWTWDGDGGKTSLQEVGTSGHLEILRSWQNSR